MPTFHSFGPVTVNRPVASWFPKSYTQIGIRSGPSEPIQ
jgi:hypothetical protein